MDKKQTGVLLLLLVLAFAGGILFQRSVTVGRAFRWLVVQAGGDPGIQVVAASPAASGFDWNRFEPALRKVRPEPKGTPDREGQRRELEELSGKERDFRSSGPIARAYEELIEAKRNQGISDMEVRRNHYLREDELDYQDASGEHRDDWDRRTRAVADFRDYLDDRGIRLLYVPVPNRVDTLLPFLAGEDTFLPSSPEHTAHLLALTERSVEVMDLRREFGEHALRGEDVFNRYDHHWSPFGAELAARQIARRILESWNGLRPEIVKEFDYQTLVLEEPLQNFPFDSSTRSGSPIFARQVVVDGLPIGSWPSSRIAVFGDSMVMAYGSPFSCDLTSHLSALLGYPCRSWGQGSGSPLVPRMFLDAYGPEKSPADPLIVVWVGVSRHQEYESIRDLDLEPTGLPAGRYEVEVISRPEVPDPRLAPYPEALFVIHARLPGYNGSTSEVGIFSPAFSSRKLSPESGIKTGSRVSMDLIPWEQAKAEHPELARCAVFQTDNLLVLPEYYGVISLPEP